MVFFSGSGLNSNKNSTGFVLGFSYSNRKSDLVWGFFASNRNSDSVEGFKISERKSVLIFISEDSRLDFEWTGERLWSKKKAWLKYV